MLSAEQIKESIRRAFSDVEPPPPWCLTGSREGDEPLLLEREFLAVQGQHWSELPQAFLDRAPGGYGSALSFFSDEAFRFYLPAYLVAALDGGLERADPVFHLTHGLCPPYDLAFVNPRRYGARTCRDVAVYRHAVFTPPQASAITEFLAWVDRSPDTIPEESQRIRAAITSYWSARSA